MESHSQQTNCISSGPADGLGIALTVLLRDLQELMGFLQFSLKSSRTHGHSFGE